MNLINNSNQHLNEICRINEELDNIKIIESKNTFKKSNLFQKQVNNNYIQTNSSLNAIYNINKGIDSIYDNIKLIKGNKINSKILYNVNSYTQTSDDF